MPKFRLIIFYEVPVGVSSNLVEFDSHAELLECANIIDGLDQNITYLELQDPPPVINQHYLE